MRPRLGGHLLVFLYSWVFVLGQDYSSVYLEQSWAFPEQNSSSLIFKDTRGQVDGTRVSALFLRSLNASTAVLREATALPGDGQAPFVLPASRPHAGVGAPDVTDRDTLVNLAKASWDSYIPSPSGEDWYGLDGLNWTSRFGWRPGQDGLRGHLFLSSDKSQGVVVFKGTTVFEFGIEPNPRSSERDRFNDNLLFSCCCATVAWRFETQHPCKCDAGFRRCCSSCLSDSLQDEETYYKNAEMIVDYFQHKYPHTSFWLTGHSLGGAIAALVGRRFDLPVVTFETPGERLAAIRLGLLPSNSSSLPSSDHITHIYNNVDPLATGTCNGALSVCAQAGYALESRCHTGRIMEFDLKGRWWQNPLLAHRIENVIAMIKDEKLEIPEPKEQADCQDCSTWKFGEYKKKPWPWWRRWWDRMNGRA